MKKLSVLFLVFLFFLGWSCDKTENSSPDLLEYVPEKTALIIKSNSFTKLTEALEKDDFIQANEKLPLYTFFAEAYENFSKLQTNGKSLIFYSYIGKDEIASSLLTEYSEELLENVEYDNREEYTYNGEKIKKLVWNQKTYYGVKLNRVLALSDSKLVTENIVRLAKSKIQPDDKLLKLNQSTSNRKSAFLINLKEFSKIYSFVFPNGKKIDLNDITDYLAIDFEVKNNQFRMNGVALPEENHLLGIFKNTRPAENEIAKITPVSAEGFYSFTYDDFDQLRDNISFYRREDYTSQSAELLTYAREIGTIYTPDSAAIVVNTYGTNTEEDELRSKSQHVKDFREHRIYKFSEPTYFYDALFPLVEFKSANYYTRLDQFYVFAQNTAALEFIIAAVQNKNTLAQDEAYLKTAKSLDDKSSVLLIGSGRALRKKIPQWVARTFQSDYENIDFTQREYLAAQLINHDKFMYLNAVFMDAEAKELNRSGAQLNSLKAEKEITKGPWFFKNWQTNEYDIVFQDEGNTLYFYDPEGKLSWKKELDGPILGPLKSIDIYRNGRLQLAFVTDKSFYIIDRLGNVVEPYHKTFNDPITQGLAIFDYNNNGTYRFLIIQDREVIMLNKKLEIVKGFEFTRAESSILKSPKHFRFGNRDYIVIPEESGKLNILNPRGQTRVAVSTSIDFSDNEWYVYDNLFTSTDQKGNLVQIDERGGINRIDLKLAKNHGIDIIPQLRVSLSENKLIVQDQTVKIDFGLYTAPKIHRINDKIHISFTDLQEHKTYLYDQNGELIKGFPVYGNSSADLQYMYNNEELILVVKGEKEQLLLYEVK